MIEPQITKNIRGLVTYTMANGKKTRMRYEQNRVCKPKNRIGKKSRRKYRIDLIKRGEQVVKYRCPLCKNIHEEEY